MIKIVPFTGAISIYKLNEKHTRAVFYKRGPFYVLYRAMPYIKTKLGTKFRKLDKFVSENIEHLIP